MSYKYSDLGRARIKLGTIYNLQSCSERLLKVPNDIMRKTMGDRAFAAAAPSEWNKLPSFLRHQSMTLNSFKKSLKTYLFKLAL